MKNLRFEKSFKGSKQEAEQEIQEAKESQRIRDFTEGKIPFEYHYNFPAGGELMATTDQNGIGQVGITKAGKVFDFVSLLPAGYKFVTPAYFKKHPDEETLFDYFGGTWANRHDGKVVLLGEFQSPKDILIFLHEIGHARGDKPEETAAHEKLEREISDISISKAIEEDKAKSERIKTEYEILLDEDLAKVLSKVERRAWANAILMLRQIQKDTGVDMKAIFPDFTSVKNYVNNCLGSYRRSYEWVVKEGYDPDFYKELQQYFDRWQYESL